MRRLLVIGLLLHSLPTLAQEISLAGPWRFEIDRKDAGVAQAWFKRELGWKITLPGSMAENGLGDPIREIRQQVWGGQWTNEPVWHPMVKTDYRGAAWYQTSIQVPSAWAGRSLELYLERVCWKSELWVDDSRAGARDSLSAPHIYDFGPLAPGTHRLTLRIDNRQLMDLGCNTHAYHEQSCTIYNGVIGKIELRALPPVFVRSQQVFADAASGHCEVRVSLDNRTAAAVTAKLSAGVMEGDRQIAAGNVMDVSVPPGGMQVNVPVLVPVSEVRHWDEFRQPLYEARVLVQSSLGKQTRSTRFGFREFKAVGTRFFINGKPVLLRGEANNAQFPLTGHPPMDKESWLKIFRLLKDYGLNHFRCHTWVPPEAVFDAADELGFYIQPELPNGENSIRDAAGMAWRQAEFDRILETYGNHPSFVQMTMGNEAKSHMDFLKSLVKRGRERDPRHLYASISNPEASGIKDEVPGDDFAVAHGSAKGRRRMEPYFNRDLPETMGDYRKTIEGRPVPQISHETGQWYVYPDLSEIAKYTGVLKPVTLEHFRDVAEKEGVLSQVPEFVSATGKLSLLLYKEEIERSLRTPEYGGFQLLGLQDSFDQGAAYVGQVNSFFEPKPYVTASDFREFCGPQIPLARMPKRVWTNGETFTAAIEVANYGPAPLPNATVAWRVSDGARVFAQGVFPARTIPDTGLQEIGNVNISLGGLKSATKLQLEAGVSGSGIRNRWDFWVYPQTLPADPAGVLVVKSLDAAAQKALRDGARVVLLPSAFSSQYGTAMTPPFWSPIMFANQKQTLGLLCDPAHPALADFPTDSYGNWQWFELLFQASAIRLQDTPAGYRPIIQAIDRPDRNHKLALVYETKVGKGRLLVCTLDLNRDLDKRPVARQLRHSLLAYAASAAFNPSSEIRLDGNLPAYARESYLARLSPKVTADSEQENNWATYAVDNNPQTIWHTNWDEPAPPPPHRLTVELKQPLQVKGFLMEPRKDCDHGRIAQYRISASDDGKQWRVLEEGTWPNTGQTQKVLLDKPVQARFFRLEALKEVQGRPWTSVAEFDVIPAG